MRNRMWLFGLVLVGLLTVSLCLTADSGIVASATGSGHLTVNGQLRTFSFSAVKDSSGNARGDGELYNRTSDARFRLDINCLSVSGSVATMSGTVSDSNLSAFVGKAFWFRVADNGEGANAPADQITLVAVFVLGGGIPCSENMGMPFLNIEDGNIQVH